MGIHEMWTILLLVISLVFLVGECWAYGYDSGAACGRQFRARTFQRPPCDLRTNDYCTSAGASYPWQAVKQFVRENQGLMRRMYGDQNHGHVLRTELYKASAMTYRRRKKTRQLFDTKLHLKRNELRSGAGRVLLRNDDDDMIDIDDDVDDTSPPLTLIDNDDVLNTKFVYSEEPLLSFKLGDLKKAPLFRPTSSTSSTTADEDVSTTTTTDFTTETTTSPPPLNTTTSPATTTPTTTNPLPQTKNETLLFQDTAGSKHKIHIIDGLEGVNACPAKDEIVAPYWANNTRGEVLALLNLHPFEQYVHWEKCTYEHRQMYCRDGCRCEQQYRLHRLLAYDPNNECRGIFSDWFRFPSCCICRCYSTPMEFRVTSRSPRNSRQRQTGPDDDS